MALVTGGGRGMGASHVRGLVAEGARVVIADILEEEGTALARELGPEAATFVPLDVTDERGWAAVIRVAEEHFGGLDILINNAGVVHNCSIAKTTLESWRTVVDVNLTGVFLGIRSAIAPMRARGAGSIVNISSTAGFAGAPGACPYSAAKWGVRGLTKTAAMELGRFDIRVNSVHPGLVQTPMVEDLASTPAYAMVEAARTLAIPRPGAPEELTRVVLFLASGDASFITGSEFVADGGWLLGPVRA